MSRSQSDIAADIQKGIRKANEHAREAREETHPAQTEEKATQFDGNPAPRGDTRAGVLQPPDDTPSILKKQEGPKNA